jgi:hypothetical protein
MELDLDLSKDLSDAFFPRGVPLPRARSRDFFELGERAIGDPVKKWECRS